MRVSNTYHLKLACGLDLIKNNVLHWEFHTLDYTTLEFWDGPADIGLAQSYDTNWNVVYILNN